ncbi:hypothetical protein ON010_g12208 [Phytophthora cinnamomi]|nr:hypothetical protein ON010_g12208 [Phytophthora cinnamomi]
MPIVLGAACPSAGSSRRPADCAKRTEADLDAATRAARSWLRAAASASHTVAVGGFGAQADSAAKPSHLGLGAAPPAPSALLPRPHDHSRIDGISTLRTPNDGALPFARDVQHNMLSGLILFNRIHTTTPAHAPNAFADFTWHTYRTRSHGHCQAPGQDRSLTPASASLALIGCARACTCALCDGALPYVSTDPEAYRRCSLNFALCTEMTSFSYPWSALRPNETAQPARHHEETLVETEPRHHIRHPTCGVLIVHPRLSTQCAHAHGGVVEPQQHDEAAAFAAPRSDTGGKTRGWPICKRRVSMLDASAMEARVVVMKVLAVDDRAVAVAAGFQSQASFRHSTDEVFTMVEIQGARTP